MDTKKHIEILEQELKHCYYLLDKVQSEQRLDVAKLIIDLWQQLKKEKFLLSLRKQKEVEQE